MKKRELIWQLIRACKDVCSTQQLHSRILKTNQAHDSFLATNLVTLYAKHSSLNSARKLFDETPQPTLYLWNAILRAHTKHNQWEQTLHLFRRMLSSPSTTTPKPDNFTIPIALKACSGLSAFQTGRAVHGFVKKNEEMGSDMFVGSALVELYARCGEMGDALRVFQEFPRPDVVLLTSMVTGYQQNGSAEDALGFFSEMVMRQGVVPDPVTLVSVVSACAQLGVLQAGKSVHGFVTRFFKLDTSLSLFNSLLNLYAKTGRVDAARNLFKGMNERDVISWSSMVACYAQNGKTTEALDLFNEMVDKRCEPNSVTIVSALQACSADCNIVQGRRIHGLARREGYELQKSISTALIDMYVKCSCLDDAIRLFKRAPQKDVVLWSALISGYAQNGLANESLQLFNRMLSEGCGPDAVTIVKVLMACSELAILEIALCFHGYLISSGFDDKVYVGAALIDLYSKCGSLENSVKVFEGMSERDVVVWSAMIAGYGIHGHGCEAITTFTQMIENSMVKPNNVTFLSILSACSHVGLIDEGIKIFDRMIREYRIKPDSEHYSIMVDLLGRTGKLDEAMDLIEMMPISPGPHVWGALLGACKIHRNVKMGEIAAQNLLRLDPEHAGYYFLLSNMYGEDGKWESMTQIRTNVKERGLKRMPGQSYVEIGNSVLTF